MRVWSEGDLHGWAAVGMLAVRVHGGRTLVGGVAGGGGMTGFAVFAWRGDGRYHLRDALGARTWKREAAAERQADAYNASEHHVHVNPDGYVVRNLSYVGTSGVEQTATGRIWLTEGERPCGN